jgi:TPR repeat protein
LYENGLDVEQSYEKAFEYYEQAAHLGDVNKAQYNLGVMYAKGDGIVQDLFKAREWWTKAAAQGSKSAAENLKITQHL